MITTSFPNHAKMSALVKEHKQDQSILAGDLTETGGEWTANEIAKQLMSTTDKATLDTHRKEAAPTTSQPTKDKTKPDSHRQEAAPTTPQQFSAPPPPPPPCRPQTPQQAHQRVSTSSSPYIDIHVSENPNSSNSSGHQKTCCRENRGK